MQFVMSLTKTSNQYFHVLLKLSDSTHGWLHFIKTPVRYGSTADYCTRYVGLKQKKNVFLCFILDNIWKLSYHSVFSLFYHLTLFFKTSTYLREKIPPFDDFFLPNGKPLFFITAFSAVKMDLEFLFLFLNDSFEYIYWSKAGGRGLFNRLVSLKGKRRLTYNGQ